MLIDSYNHTTYNGVHVSEQMVSRDALHHNVHHSLISYELFESLGRIFSIYPCMCLVYGYGSLLEGTLVFYMDLGGGRLDGVASSRGFHLDNCLKYILFNFASLVFRRDCYVWDMHNQPPYMPILGSYGHNWSLMLLEFNCH